MESMVSLYNKLRVSDKLSVKRAPLENRIVLGQLITHSPADVALQYAWVNRALAQSTQEGRSAIMSLGDDAPPEQLLARELSIKLRTHQGLANPVIINHQDDVDFFMENYNGDTLVIKQNYPSENGELERFQKFNLGGTNREIANSISAYRVIESKQCLANLSNKDSEWFHQNISEYLDFIFARSAIMVSDSQREAYCDEMVELVTEFLIPTKIFRGSCSELYSLVSDLIKDDFLPVFKFNYSVSGYGVHFPKSEKGDYDVKTLLSVMQSESSFVDYLVGELNKNGQVMSREKFVENISQKGITLQRFLLGHEHSIGYFKPLQFASRNYFLGLTEFVVTDVMVEGTAHYGNTLHYDSQYIYQILKKTKFKDRADLLHFSIEIILYLLYLDNEQISSPAEFASICVEDFGIQFIVDDNSGKVGLIEFNGRTPSCNLNHYHLLSRYGFGFEKSYSLPSKVIAFTNINFMSARKMLEIAPTSVEQNYFVNVLLDGISERFGNKVEIVSLQVINGMLSANFGFYLGKSERVSDLITVAKQCLSHIHDTICLNLSIRKHIDARDYAKIREELQRATAMCGDTSIIIDMGFSIENYDVLMDILQCDINSDPTIDTSFGNQQYFKVYRVFKTGFEHVYFCRLEEYGPGDVDAMKCSMVATQNLTSHVDKIMSKYSKRSIIKEMKLFNHFQS